MSPNVRRLLLIALLISAVLVESCIIPDKTKGEPDIRIIELDDSKESSESEIVTLHLPDRRRREANQTDHERSGPCKSDDDCGPGSVCLAYIACVKGKWRTI